MCAINFTGAIFLWFTMVIIASPISATEDGLLVWWRFDEVAGKTAYDSIGQVEDTIIGNFKFVDGVRSKGLKFDGFSTRVLRKSQDALCLGEAFTIEAWVAIQAYPWGWCPIVTQHRDRKAGYLFAIDAQGHLGLHLAIDGQWRKCTSKIKLPLMKWTHIAGSFNKDRGITLFVNGKVIEHLYVKGSPTYMPDVGFQIGRNHGQESAMLTAFWGAQDQPVFYSFDGIIDELKIYDRCLNEQEIEHLCVEYRPADAPDLKPRRLPSGPKEICKFGAFYHHLKYTEEWDSIWRGSGPGVVVTFDVAPIRLVFWRGISYAPCWVTEKDNWFSNEFMERGMDRKNRGCSESMSDKQAHYSHVKILENNDARTVVYWRNAPVGVNYEFAYVDEETGWGDWSEEYHTIYPDGVAVRKVVMWSSDLQSWHEWCQSLEVLHPGQHPEDVLDAKRILSVADMKGRCKTFGWESGNKSYGYPTIDGANIQITYLKSKFNPFLILDDREGSNGRGGNGPAIARVGGNEWSPHSPFPWANHWPVTQIPILARHAQAADRPSHTWTSTQYSAPYETTANSMTKIMLCGLTDKKVEELLPLAKSWLRAPEIVIDSDAFINEGFDPTQRAYILTCKEPGKLCQIKLKLLASKETPIVNPAFILAGWGEASASLKINGKPVSQGKDFRMGHRRRLQGTDLILWIEAEATSLLQIDLSPSAS